MGWITMRPAPSPRAGGGQPQPVSFVWSHEKMVGVTFGGPGDHGLGHQGRKLKALPRAVTMTKTIAIAVIFFWLCRFRAGEPWSRQDAGPEPEITGQYISSGQAMVGPPGMLQSARNLWLLVKRSVTHLFSCVLKDCSPTSMQSAHSTAEQPRSPCPGRHRPRDGSEHSERIGMPPVRHDGFLRRLKDCGSAPRTRATVSRPCAHSNSVTAEPESRPGWRAGRPAQRRPP